MSEAIGLMWPLAWLRDTLRGRVRGSATALPATTGPRPPGRVSLVGAGPGSADLVTLRGLDRLRTAEVVIHDRLCDPALLAFANPSADRVDVGKAPGRHPWPQARIDRLIVAEALQGRRVVRLKGGDPSVFGRAAEEIGALLAAGLSVEIVPGVTAASAAAAEIGVPLTDRHGARSVVLVSGHPAAGASEPDWDALVASGATLAIYMGVARAGAIAGALVRAGLDPETAVDVVERAGRPLARHLATRLGTLGDTLRAAGTTNPAMILVRPGRLAKDSAPPVRGLATTV